MRVVVEEPPREDVDGHVDHLFVLDAIVKLALAPQSVAAIDVFERPVIVLAAFEFEAEGVVQLHLPVGRDALVAYVSS